MSRSTTFVAIWLLAALVAVLMTLNMNTAALVDGSYVPVGNDSFYHARRILDAVLSERGFYQFDSMIHVPEGSWLNWPWGYDYFMATALSAALFVNPDIEPMGFLAHIPVVWLLINSGLLTLICWKMEIRPFFTAVVLFGYAFLPLTQTLHGVGIIDHHFVEQTFVLATIAAGIGFFRSNARRIDAVILGALLGLAPAFHNGLFILQVPVLTCILISWIRDNFPDKTLLVPFAISLFVVTTVVLLPSEPFRDMQFEFWTLSWFHAYIAFSSAVITTLLAFKRFSSKTLAIIVLAGMILAVPLFAKVLVGASFLSGDMSIIREVHEVKSPFTRLSETGGLKWITSFYSWLFFLIPVLIVLFAVRAWQRTSPSELFISVMALFGLGLLLAQYRFHPFGSWAILVGSVLYAQEISAKWKLRAPISAGLVGLVLIFAYQPPFKNRLFQRYPPGGNVDYAATRSLYRPLAESCATDAGIAISYSDDGHYVRYHTDCSVISNNFLMTPQHEGKVLELDRLLQLNPEQFLEAAPHVKYIFARMFQIFGADETGLISPTPTPVVASVNAPLFVGLTFADELPKEYVLLDELRVDDDRDFAFARVFKIVRDTEGEK